MAAAGEMQASRLVVQADAFEWLDSHPAEPGMSIVTSLPDVSELSQPLEAWRAWFIAIVERLIHWLPEDGVAIFYQSDVRVKGFWIDKGYLVLRGAENADARVLWHKIVCRKPPGTVALGRASYSHMIAVTRATALEKPLSDPARSPDVLPSAGEMNWSRAMGKAACEVACRYLLEHANATTIIDPFCGKGTVLAVANALGLAAIGIDVVASRCRAARTVTG